MRSFLALDILAGLAPFANMHCSWLVYFLYQANKAKDGRKCDNDSGKGYDHQERRQLYCANTIHLSVVVPTGLTVGAVGARLAVITACQAASILSEVMALGLTHAIIFQLASGVRLLGTAQEAVRGGGGALETALGHQQEESTCAQA